MSDLNGQHVTSFDDAIDFSNGFIEDDFADFIPAVPAPLYASSVQDHANVARADIREIERTLKARKSAVKLADSLASLMLHSPREITRETTVGELLAYLNA